MKKKSNYSKLLEITSINKTSLTKILLLVILTLLIFILKDILINIFFFTCIFIISALSIYWKRFTKLSLGIELYSFFSIVLSITISPKVGIFFAVSSIILGYLLINRFCYMMLVPIIGCVIISVLSPYLYYFEFPIIGLILNFIYNLIIHLIYVLILRFKLINSIMSFAFNFLLNILLFNYVLEYII